MPGAAIDITGQTFGRLTVLRREGTDRHRRATWFCRCECGEDTVAPGTLLRGGGVISCGCYQRDHPPNAKLTKDEAREVLRLAREGDLTHREIGEEFGVDRSTVGAILHGRIRADLE